MQKQIYCSNMYAVVQIHSGKTIWATSHENVSLDIFDQVRFKPACSATETS